MFSRLNTKVLALLKEHQFAYNILNRQAERNIKVYHDFFKSEGLDIVWYKETCDILADLGLGKLFMIYDQLSIPKEFKKSEKTYLHNFKQIILSNKDKLDLANNTLTVNARKDLDEILQFVKEKALELYKKENALWEKLSKQELKTLRAKKVLVETNKNYDLKTYCTLQKINLALSGLENIEFLPTIELVNFNLFENHSIYYVKKSNTIQIRYLTESNILRFFFNDYINNFLDLKKAN